MTRTSVSWWPHGGPLGLYTDLTCTVNTLHLLILHPQFAL